MVSDRPDKVQDDIRFRILRLLEKKLTMSQPKLAVRISTGGTHYLLKTLIDTGFSKLGRFATAVDKRRYASILTAWGMAAKAKVTRVLHARRLGEYELREIAAMAAYKQCLALGEIGS